MFFLWGKASGEENLGVVAERCPRCGTVGPCLVSGNMEGIHVYFVTLAESVSRAIAICATCHHSFACEAWRYPAMLPVEAAASLSAEEVLARTNPALRARMAREELLSRFAGDEAFVSARHSIESLREGDLRGRLWAALSRWDRLGGRERIELVREAEESARALKFAESVAPRVPSDTGCLVALAVCLSIWSTLIWAPEVRGNLLWAVGTGLLGLVAGGAVQQPLFKRRMRIWVDEVLISEGKKSGVDFQRLFGVIDDLPPPGPRNEDVLRHLKEGIDVIRDQLAAAGLVAGGKPHVDSPDQV